MIDFPFSYRIISVDNSAKSMEVEYSAAGHETIVSVVPLPHLDAILDDHLRAHAPFFTWVISKKKHLMIEPGKTGTIYPIVIQKVNR